MLETWTLRVWSRVVGVSETGICSWNSGGLVERVVVQEWRVATVRLSVCCTLLLCPLSLLSLRNNFMSQTSNFRLPSSAFVTSEPLHRLLAARYYIHLEPVVRCQSLCCPGALIKQTLSGPLCHTHYMLVTETIRIAFRYFLDPETGHQ